MDLHKPRAALEDDACGPETRNNLLRLANDKEQSLCSLVALSLEHFSCPNNRRKSTKLVSFQQTIAV